MFQSVSWRAMIFHNSTQILDRLTYRKDDKNGVKGLCDDFSQARAN